MGDCLNIQILATFNVAKEAIDKALLRPGRLVASWEFGPLSIDNSNKLIKHLGKNYTAYKPMTLAKIYSLDNEPINNDKKE